MNLAVYIVNGDLLKSDCELIGHQVNCLGTMGAGIAKQIANKYPIVEQKYRKVCNTFRQKRKQKILLGLCLYVQINESFTVANMFGQYAYGRDRRFTDYEKLWTCLNSLAFRGFTQHKKVGLPYGLLS